jgi:hypothetical protein
VTGPPAQTYCPESEGPHRARRVTPLGSNRPGTAPIIRTSVRSLTAPSIRCRLVSISTLPPLERSISLTASRPKDRPGEHSASDTGHVLASATVGKSGRRSIANCRRLYSLFMCALGASTRLLLVVEEVSWTRRAPSRDLRICECRCGAPGWRTTRLGVGDRCDSLRIRPLRRALLTCPSWLPAPAWPTSWPDQMPVRS